MLEFQIHGGTAVKQKFLETLSQIPNFREAEPVSLKTHSHVYFHKGRIHQKSTAKW